MDDFLPGRPRAHSNGVYCTTSFAYCRTRCVWLTIYIFGILRKLYFQWNRFEGIIERRIKLNLSHVERSYFAFEWESTIRSMLETMFFCLVLLLLGIVEGQAIAFEFAFNCFGWIWMKWLTYQVLLICWHDTNIFSSAYFYCSTTLAPPIFCFSLATDILGVRA